MKPPSFTISFLLACCSVVAANDRLRESPRFHADQTPEEILWSTVPPTRHSPPAVSDENWVSKPIDAFILARLDEIGLRPSRSTSRGTWLRRVTFDLTGLPPKPEELHAFLKDSSPEAFERVVDRLLASPHFGERWARLWLDIARYAEDQAHIVGNDKSDFYPNAYLYRDWIVQAFNEDMPYDQFITFQLAADYLDAGDQSQLVALGFIGLGPKYYRRRTLEVMADEWENQVDTVTRGILGLTVACARCHDHKFDPISAKDYHALAGVFASTELVNVPVPELVAAADKQDGFEAKNKEPDPTVSMHIVRDHKVRDIPLFERGNVRQPGPLVPRRFLATLSVAGDLKFSQGSGRLELAQALASRENPLTARVFVNRIWGEIFDQPLVRTTSNWGSLGEEPSHPNLLDDLAVRFMDKGWSLKSLLRELVLSSTYRQSTRPDHGNNLDADNRLLWRMSLKRLTVEQLRDAVLATSGVLDDQIGGPSIDPADPQATRRTLYARISRLELNRLLSTFDFPDANNHAAQRVLTTTPLQKLYMMNGPLFVEGAKRLAQRIQATSASDDAREMIHQAYELLYCRQPTDRETQIGTDFLAANASDEGRWTKYCQILLAANEFMFLD